MSRASGRAIKPGITTLELDKMAEDYFKKNGAVPTFLGYQGFPNSICASINGEVVHGIPNHRRLEEGDIIAIDLGATLNGFVGDAARTHGVGNISETAKKLIDVTRESFFKGIAFARQGYRLSDVSHAIQCYVEANGFSVVRDYVGHGIGREMHEDPQFPILENQAMVHAYVRECALPLSPWLMLGIMMSKFWIMTGPSSLQMVHYQPIMKTPSL